ncbi:hypothetical protein G7046_g9027 [Stylonectria norvegica]|nr:hypothetical protein G7046_g9027 [Stylonectria norvegica]
MVIVRGLPASDRSIRKSGGYQGRVVDGQKLRVAPPFGQVLVLSAGQKKVLAIHAVNTLGWNASLESAPVNVADPDVDVGGLTQLANPPQTRDTSAQTPKATRRGGSERECGPSSYAHCNGPAEEFLLAASPVDNSSSTESSASLSTEWPTTTKAYTHARSSSSRTTLVCRPSSLVLLRSSAVPSVGPLTAAPLLPVSVMITFALAVAGLSDQHLDHLDHHDLRPNHHAAYQFSRHSFISTARTRATTRRYSILFRAPSAPLLFSPPPLVHPPFSPHSLSRQPPPMAPPSPRRSSRARATNSQSQQSSVSSSTSGRLERNMRSVNKPSSNKSTPSASLSSEPLEDLDDTLLGRRRKRGQDDEIDKPPRPGNFDVPNASDDLQDEEDEAVRCICGSEDYPGRPPVEGPDADFFAAIELTDDVTGFFVQCDICKVWQHGACVGIFSAESSPDEYFCEQCRKDLHKIHIASNGQKYSKYVPLHRPSRATSRAASIVKEGTRSPKTGGSKGSRPNSASRSSKRRATMNSRDRAYDDEQLLKAIEASKEDAPLDSPDSTNRRPKRGRSDSEESVAGGIQPQEEKLISLRNPPNIKRQRTSSRSASPIPEPIEAPSHEDSDEETSNRNGLKKARNGKIQKEKTEKEDKERQRQEAASKRKGRADRRRAEDSDPSEEAPPVVAKPPVVTKVVEPPVVIELPVVAPPVPDTPPATHPPISSTHKRGGRNNHKKGKGRNQYTRDRDADNGDSPARSMSRDIQKNGEESTTTAAHTKADHRHTKSKSALANKLSMMDMKRRVGAIMDFISRTQVDLAAEAPASYPGDSKPAEASPRETPAPQANGSTRKSSDAAHTDESTPEPSHEKDFKELSCIEMMDALTRDMVKWQNQYA